MNSFVALKKSNMQKNFVDRPVLAYMLPVWSCGNVEKEKPNPLVR
jgi:hypothetical protein